MELLAGAWYSQQSQVRAPAWIHCILPEVANTGHLLHEIADALVPIHRDKMFLAEAQSLQCDVRVLAHDEVDSCALLIDLNW